MTVFTLSSSESFNFDHLDKGKRPRYNVGTAAGGISYVGSTNQQLLTHYFPGNMNTNVTSIDYIPQLFPFSYQNFDMSISFKDNDMSLIEFRFRLCIKAPS